MVADGAVDNELEWPGVSKPMPVCTSDAIKTTRRTERYGLTQLRNQADHANTPLCELTVSQDISKRHCHPALPRDPVGPQLMFAGRHCRGSPQWCRNVLRRCALAWVLASALHGRGQFLDRAQPPGALAQQLQLLLMVLIDSVAMAHADHDRVRALAAYQLI